MDDQDKPTHDERPDPKRSEDIRGESEEDAAARRQERDEDGAGGLEGVGQEGTSEPQDGIAENQGGGIEDAIGGGQSGQGGG